MREIICRGKAVRSGEYVYGAYVYDEVHKKHFIIHTWLHGLTETSVHKESVGQLAFVLNDGTKVFENDVVKTKYQDKASVVWDNPNACFATKTIDDFVKDDLMFCMNDIIEVLYNENM